LQKNPLFVSKLSKDRRRLSIDLDAYPDVKSMLEDAVKATGNTQTEIVIQALKQNIPAVVTEIRDNANKFLKKYPS
jgi:hypothetical protein